jgi:hypothetical protein
VQDERLRDGAKQLLRIAYERQVASGEVGMPVRRITMRGTEILREAMG